MKSILQNEVDKLDSYIDNLILASKKNDENQIQFHKNELKKQIEKLAFKFRGLL